METIVSGDYGPLPEIHRGFSSPQHIRRIIILLWHCCRQKEFAVEILLGAKRCYGNAREPNVAVDCAPATVHAHGNSTAFISPCGCVAGNRNPYGIRQGTQIPVDCCQQRGGSDPHAGAPVQLGGHVGLPVRNLQRMIEHFVVCRAWSRSRYGQFADLSKESLSLID